MTNRRATPGECPRKSKYNNGELIAADRKYNKPPFSVVFNIPKKGRGKYVITESGGKLCAGHAFLLRCVEALNAHEQSRTENE